MPFYQATNQAVADLTRFLAEQLDSITDLAVIAIDGRSGAGKSTIAEAIAGRLDAVVVDGDDFYAGGTLEQWEAMTPAQRVDHCIDWRRQRAVLGALRSGLPALYQPYDWEAFDGSLADDPIVIAPTATIVLEGVYSGRSELADLVDLAVLVETPDEQRRRRRAERDGAAADATWDALWSSAEDHYFATAVDADRFDVVVSGDDERDANGAVSDG